MALLFLVATVPEFRDPSIYKADQTSADNGGSAQDQNSSADEQPDRPQWRDWTERLVSTEDTLAQWVMAFFSIAATIVSYLAVRLVGDTLELNRTTTTAAVEAAKSAREAIHTDRAWLTFHEPKTGIIQSSFRDKEFIQNGLGFKCAGLTLVGALQLVRSCMPNTVS